MSSYIGGRNRGQRKSLFLLSKMGVVYCTERVLPNVWLIIFKRVWLSSFTGISGILYILGSLLVLLNSRIELQ